eukprot:CAMPEP_0179454898 /NCGR_PEP_ID=MMETSP0799-20121207/38881_1 /TAXON_ID=46947 /ORGANISM="Geminigera cryophila, Strain CCMP2564" /LENGTH=69 /DNA_ID=CAMNT_0021253475 /DNA_START=41 /DNA_END=250 /DNA_ORIENTATION=+
MSSRHLIETFVSAITRQESPMADCESGGGRRVYTRACARARRTSSAKPPITRGAWSGWRRARKVSQASV